MAKHATPARQLVERPARILEPLEDRFSFDTVTVRHTPRLGRLLAPMPGDERRAQERGQR